MKTLRRFLALAAPFWLRQNPWYNWLLLAAVVGFSLAIVRVGVLITDWNKTFYDALAAFDGRVMPALILEYLVYIILVTAFVACGNWLRKVLLFRWREHLTGQFQTDWLGGHKHYRLHPAHPPDRPQTATPEHRAPAPRSRLPRHLLRVRDHAEQIALYHGENAEQGRLNARFPAVKNNWRSLIRREFYLESFSAAYLRLSMFIPIIATLPMYLAHSMSFGDMMKARSAFSNVQDGFGWFMDYYKRIIEWAAVVERLAHFQAALDQVPADSRQPETSIPSPACGGELGWGETADTSANIVSNETTPPPQPSPAQAQEREQVADSITSSPKAQRQPENLSDDLPAANPKQPETLLTIRALNLHTAEGRPLLHHLNLNAAAPEWLLLDGRSGIGKTTLMRTLAGLWPYYAGRFSIQGARSLFLPQRPYLPQDTLANLVRYPTPPEGSRQDDAVAAALEKVGLGRLKECLHSEEDWHKTLSGGEQQRISLARALIAQPDILFLDEATNQLDDDSATALLRLLKSELPDTLVIGISHQPPVKALFDRREDLSAFAADN